MGIKVVEPGLSTSVQDKGRQGYYNVGIPPSGAMDHYSHIAANLLVGNENSEATLECTYLGPALELEEDAIVAVAGAEMQPLRNGEPMPLWSSFAVKEGDKLTFDYLQSGARAYIAVAGGIDVPVILGSRSLYGLGGFGGYEGRTLQAGDLLPVGQPTGRVQVGRSAPQELIPEFPQDTEVRVMMGLYDFRLSEQGHRDFLETEWALTPVADRIGLRYKGKHLSFVEREQPFGAGSDPSNIVDAGYPIGSIQVPGGQEPIVLHRDAVSGGGYAMIGTVISADMDLVGQTQPNSKTRFVPVNLDEALEAHNVYREREMRLREALA